jgi:hypothetical protein
MAATARRTLATSSRLKGHDQIVIAKQGGWGPHSKVLAGYLEVVDQWEDNALLGVLQTGLSHRTDPHRQLAAPPLTTWPTYAYRSSSPRASPPFGGRSRALRWGVLPAAAKPNLSTAGAALDALESAVDLRDALPIAVRGTDQGSCFPVESGSRSPGVPHAMPLHASRVNSLAAQALHCEVLLGPEDRPACSPATGWRG